MAQYANKIGYSDVVPYEIVRVIGKKTLEIREMDAELDAAWKPECHVGGFCCHVSNNRDQRWVITPNTNAHTIRVRARKDGYYYDKYGTKFSLSDQPRKFYDYNF